MAPELETRLSLARKGTWPLALALEYFDLSEGFVQSLASEKNTGLVPQAGMVDRFLLEKLLDLYDVRGLAWAALAHGLDANELRRVMKDPPKSSRPGAGSPFPIDTYARDGRYLVSAKHLEGWLDSWLPRHKTWSSVDARSRELAATLEIPTLACAVSIAAREHPPAVATARCIVSWDFISIAHKEYLDNGKPLMLTPDYVGWHVIRDGTVPTPWLRGHDLSRMQEFFARPAS